MNDTRFEVDKEEFRILLLEDGSQVGGFRLARTFGLMIHTAIGDVPASSLRRQVLYCEEEKQFTIREDFYSGDTLVRNDVHVILKEGSVEASAVLANVGG